MVNNINNLAFEGAGVLGIAYLGVLDYLYQNDLLKNVMRTAGTSSGAITACVTSFQLPFEDIRGIANSLNYRKVPNRSESDASSSNTEDIIFKLEPLLGDLNCLYRLITRYGWFSSEYFYHWIKNVIANQFNNKKQPPYTFKDFKNSSLHKENRSFLDLYIVGTNLTTGTSKVFSYETTPMMEVADAVRISMSIPLFFEAIEVKQYDITGNNLTNFFCDGGVINNYPIRIFDSPSFNPNLLRGANMDTLGVRFMSRKQYFKIDNLLEYIWSLTLASNHIQQEEYYSNPMDIIRSINIDSLNISPIDFNISPNDETYKKLYSAGYSAAEEYFTKSTDTSVIRSSL